MDNLNCLIMEKIIKNVNKNEASKAVQDINSALPTINGDSVITDVSLNHFLIIQL